MSALDINDVYLVWSNEHAGWWRAGGWGYSPGVKAAGRFTRDQALKICRDALPTAMHLGRISEIPVRLVDLAAFCEGAMIPASVTGEGEEWRQ